MAVIKVGGINWHYRRESSDRGIIEQVFENNACHLLEQRLHNANMKEFLAENPDKLPAGLQADSKYKITVRKPTGK
mgnify:CR=1 FL=1